MEIKCPDCGIYYSDKNLICPYCNTTIKETPVISNKQTMPKVENNQLKQCRSCAMMIPKKAKVCPHCQKRQGIPPIIAAIIIILFTIFIFHVGINSQTSSISIGKDYMLDSGAELVPIAINETAFDEWTKARVAKDDRGMTVLLFTQRVFTVDKGTSVRIIDQGNLIRKVRILNGEKEGLSGWVAKDYIK